MSLQVISECLKSKEASKGKCGSARHRQDMTGNIWYHEACSSPECLVNNKHRGWAAYFRAMHFTFDAFRCDWSVILVNSFSNCKVPRCDCEVCSDRGKLHAPKQIDAREKVKSARQPERRRGRVDVIYLGFYRHCKQRKQTSNWQALWICL